MEVGKVQCWSRSEISTCNCSEKPYRHVHCPCSDCKGQATDQSTELQHWNQMNILIDHKTQLSIVDPGIDHEESARQSTDSDNQADFLENNFSEGENEMETAGSGFLDLEEDLSQQEPVEQPVHLSDQEPTANMMTNPLRKLVVTAVLDALKIKRNSGVSVGIFEDILEYAKKLTFHS